MSCRKITRKITGIISLLILACLILPTAVLAYPSHTDYISDAAVILDENTENSIKSASAELMKTKNSRFAVCTVLNTGDESVRDYATALFKEWNVGNGVLILLVTESDTYYAVQSNSVAEVLTGERLSEILGSTLEPRFAEKDYSAGALSAVNALSVFLNNNLPEGFGESKKSGIPGWLSAILKVILVLAIIIIAGYVALVIAEKRKARRRREEMEARRRMVASGIRSGGYGQMPRGYNGRGPAGRPPQGNRAPVPGNRQRSAGAPYRGGARPQRPASSAPQNAQRPRRSQTPDGYNMNTAATIQINTADIRAAKQAQSGKGPRR